MKKFRLNIDGKEILGIPGQTILEAAKENDIFIPTLCFDERTEIYGSCGICVCEMEGNSKLVKACATEIAPNMVIKTSTERVIESRKASLELLLSNHTGDCRPPCVLACPAHTDCQGYVGLIANGEFDAAVELVKGKIPLPASIGRVCPHPCEDKCRRGLMDEPISIQWLKRFIADYDMLGEKQFMPEIASDTGKSVAIIGGGPMGLSAAYFLRQKGHSVTIFEAMPRLGGMLRYGIPEYRLPKEVLNKEIKLIEKMGVKLVTNVKVGVDISFDVIKRDFDAVLLGIGAWISTGVGCKGEDAEGVIGGIDFLRKVVRNEVINIGDNVAIVGGGNTAMDASRTAVRLGAKKVYNVYRRTKDEMPADQVEIIEAEEEGVIFKSLTNPIEIVKDENNKAIKMVLQVMELGEPDSSGRRAPRAVEGKTETLDVDTIILAIGQAVDSNGFEDLDKTRKNSISYDKDTFMTSIPGVFAGGDCGNDKISIAIEAISDAKKVSDTIDSYLNGVIIKYEKPYYVERNDISEKTFEDRERECKPKMNYLYEDERKDNFTEVVFGYNKEDAVKDASRCLECGCHDYFECKLVNYANKYGVKPERFEGDKNEIEFEDNHPFIIRDPNKCILCGLCVRICDEVVGACTLGFVNRGFDTIVKPALEKPLNESGCISCGQCISVCPTGALQERLAIKKSVPLETTILDTTCSYCSVGCAIKLETCKNMMIKANPNKEGKVNSGLICGKGKFGFAYPDIESRILDPMIKDNDNFRKTDYHETLLLAAKKIEAVGLRYGRSSVAVSISDRYTNEEAYVIKKLADTIGAKTLCFNNRESGIERVLGTNVSPNTIDELLSTEVILVAGFDMMLNPVIGFKLRQAFKNGAKILLINPVGYEQSFDFVHKEIYTDNSNYVLKGISKALIDMGKKSEAKGFSEFAKSLEHVNVSKEIREIAEIYSKAKKAMIVFQQNFVTTEAASLIAEIALISGHIGSPRDGILQVKAKNNSQGIVNLGIKAGKEALEGVKALIVFGEDVNADLSNIEFLMVCDTCMTDTAKKADVIIPGTHFASSKGTYTNTEGRLLNVNQAIQSDVIVNNWQIAAEIAHIYEIEFGFKDICDISKEMKSKLAAYRDAETGEIYANFKNLMPKFINTDESLFADPLFCTDNLMNMISEKLSDTAVE